MGDMSRHRSELLRLDNVSKQFGQVQAVQNISLNINKGELVTFIGPSGCGKTTLLRMIAGFYKPTSGGIYLGETKINDFPPEKRATGMVFQNYALFPHMTVFENVAYGLDILKKTKREKRSLVQEALSQVRLEGYEDRKPRELSGGQQQRVAIARCLVLKPKVLLLDEPLSNLDANLRNTMRDEIKRLKEDLDLTIIFVTHDQEEALSISDRVMVLNEGRLQQLDRPEVIYKQPANAFVASFVGQANMLSGKLENEGGEKRFVTDDFPFAVHAPEKVSGERWMALIRPEMIRIDPQGTVEGIVKNRTYHGHSVRYEVSIGKTVLMVDDYDVHEKKMFGSGDSVKLNIPRKLHFVRP